MADNYDGGGGGFGKYSADNLSLAEMKNAVDSDAAQIPKMEGQEDGWKKFHSMLVDLQSDLNAERPNLADNFSSPAGNFYLGELDRIIASAKDAEGPVEHNATSTRQIIDEIERLQPIINDLHDEQTQLDGTPKSELKSFADSSAGTDGYTTVKNDILADAREAFDVSNTSFAVSNAGMNPPPKFDGPRWYGKQPENSLDTYQHAYYPEGGMYTPAGHGEGGGPRELPNPTPANSTVPSGGPDSSGPQLQHPGGVTSPVPTVPNAPVTPGGTPAIPGGSGPGGFPGVIPGTAPGGLGPGGTGPGNSPVSPRPVGGAKPVIPPARSTPGLGTRPTPSPGLRPGMPPGRGGAMPGREGLANGRGSMPNNRGAMPNVRGSMPNGRGATPNGRGSLPGGREAMPNGRGGLPNGRSGVPGRTSPGPGSGNNPGMARNTGSGPRQGIGGRSANTGGANSRGPGAGQRSAMPRTGAAEGWQTPRTGKPNAGFESDMANNSRSNRTGPSVVRGRMSGTESETAFGRRQSVGGNEIGMRGAKAGRSGAREKPKYRAGSLTGGGVVSSGITKSDHSWARTKRAQTTDLPSQSVLGRREYFTPKAPDATAAAARDRRRMMRRDLFAGRPVRNTEASSEFLSGIAARTTPSVIRGAAPAAPVTRGDTGRLFSTRGWEDEV